MADSYGSVTIEYPGNGTQVLFTFPFEYIKESDVCVYLLDESTKMWVKTTDWTFENATTIKFNTAPPAPSGDDDNIKISRVTDDSGMIATFNPGSAIRARDLNDDFEQLLFLTQENKEGISSNSDSIRENIEDLKEYVDNADQNLQNQIDTKVTTISGVDPIVADRTDNDVVVSIKESSSTQDGSMSKEDKAKLDSIPADAASGTVKKVTGVAPVEVTDSTTEPAVSMQSANASRDGYMPKEYAAKLDSVEFVEVHNATFQEPIDGTRKTFTLDHQANSAFDLTVSVNGIIQQANVHYTWDATTSEITFVSAPPASSEYWITISGFQMADGSVGGFQTTATLPTAPGPFAQALRKLAPYEVFDDDVPFQKDVNQLFNTTNIKSALNLGRTGDLIDFTNNSVTQAYWVHTQVDADQFPDEAEFWAYDENDNETTQFTEIRKIIFNDNGIVANPGTENKLQDVRIGDYLIMQEVDQNHFGMYVIIDKTTYQGSIREFVLKVYRDGERAFGDCQYFAHCSVRVIRPTYVVVQDDTPAVSDRGVLWYRQSDDILSIANYGDGFTGTGPQWTEINAPGGGGGGSDVSVGENPPDNPTEGALWFDTARLELYIYYVEGEDGAWLPTSPLGARVAAGELLQQQILSRVDTIEADYLEKSGGEVTGRLDVTGPAFVSDTTSVFKRTGATAGSNYVLSAEAPFLDPEGVKDVAFRVTADGAVKAGHDTTTPFMASSKNDVVTKAYADDNLLQKDKSNDVTTSFRVKADGSTLISASGNELGLYHVKDPTSGNAEWAATKGYVDGEIAKIDTGGGGGGGAYLPLTGGTVTGDIVLNGGALQCLNGQPVDWFDQSGNWAAEFKGKGDKTFEMIHNQGVSVEWKGRSTSGVDVVGVSFDPRLMQWSFRNLKEPGANSDAATKDYVDRQVVSAGLTWAPTKFKYRSDGNTTNINPGEFYIGSSNGERAIVLHHAAADGVNWTFHEASVDWTQTFNGPCGIRGIDGQIYFQADTVSMTTYGLPADRKHVLVRTQNSRRPGTLVNGQEYIIYIPGILPRFIQS